MDKRELIFRLAHCRGLSRGHMRQLLAFASQMNEGLQIDHLSSFELAQILKIPLTQAKRFVEDWRQFDTKKYFDKYQHDKIGFITLFEDHFPPLLKAIPDPPLILFYIGNLHLLQHPQTLSVVGTRNPSKEGLQAMKHILIPLIKQNWLLVSGLAKGVDGFAHTLALESATIAVLGSGFYHLYPKEHLSLFEKICQKHLVLSEYPPSTQPQKWFFPERNRLISGLTMATLVVEAKERSGSLITADQALEQGREVLAIPGSIFNPFSQGTNSLIKQGATLVTCAEDLIQAAASVSTFL